jgi:hypothetical protein
LRRTLGCGLSPYNRQLMHAIADGKVIPGQFTALHAAAANELQLLYLFLKWSGHMPDEKAVSTHAPLTPHMDMASLGDAVERMLNGPQT